MLRLFPGGLGFRTLVRKTSRCQPTDLCVILHDAYWQLEHFIPYPFSPIELVVVLFSFQGLRELSCRQLIVVDNYVLLYFPVCGND